MSRPNKHWADSPLYSRIRWTKHGVDKVRSNFGHTVTFHFAARRDEFLKAFRREAAQCD